MSVEQQTSSGGRRIVNISVDSHLWTEAGKFKVDISRAVDQGLARALAECREALWLKSNRAAMDSSNEFVEKYGLPLAKYRGF